MAADVSGLIAAAQSYASSTLRSAEAELSNASEPLTSFIGGGTLGSFSTGGLGEPALPGSFVPAIPPQLTPLTLTNYPVPGSAPVPQLVPDPLVGVGDIPANNVVVPAYIDPQIPAQLAAFTELSPSITTDFTFPDVPAALSITIDPPLLIDRAEPTAPQVILPTFDLLAPTDLPAPPSDYAAQFAAQYREQSPAMYAALEGQMDAFLSKMNPQYQSQLAKLQSRLSKYLDGGTALTPAVQDAIYERTRDKGYAEYRRTRDASFDDAAKRGFTMPGGALLSAVQQARQQAADNNARAAIEIGVKIAEMEQQNLQFAVTQTASMVATTMQVLIGYHQSLVGINGQALDAAKSVLQALIETYNALVRGFEAKLEGYKAEAQVYDTKLRAAMASIELYKEEISALEAMTHVDLAKVEIYKGRIEALNTLANVYKTEVEAVMSKASLEKLKIELFGAKVQAYTATVQAKAAEYNGYAAQVNGQEAKVRVYSEQLRGYGIDADVWKTKVDGKMEQIKAISVNNQALAETYKAIVSAYATKVEANAKLAETKISFDRDLIQEYSIANQAAVSAAQVKSDLYRVQTQVAVSYATLAQTKMLEESRIHLEAAKAIAANAIAAGGVYGQLASSAMAGMNTLVAQTS